MKAMYTEITMIMCVIGWDTTIPDKIIILERPPCLMTLELGNRSRQPAISGLSPWWKRINEYLMLQTFQRQQIFSGSWRSKLEFVKCYHRRMVRCCYSTPNKPYRHKLYSSCIPLRYRDTDGERQTINNLAKMYALFCVGFLSAAKCITSIKHDSSEINCQPKFGYLIKHWLFFPVNITPAVQ